MTLLAVDFPHSTPGYVRYPIRRIVDLLNKIANDPLYRPAIGILSTHDPLLPKMPQISATFGLIFPEIDVAILSTDEFLDAWASSVSLDGQRVPNFEDIGILLRGLQ